MLSGFRAPERIGFVFWPSITTGRRDRAVVTVSGCVGVTAGQERRKTHLTLQHNSSEIHFYQGLASLKVLSCYFIRNSVRIWEFMFLC